MKNITQTAITNIMEQCKGRFENQRFENQQHALFHDVCNRRLCYVFNETEMAKKEIV